MNLHAIEQALLSADVSFLRVLRALNAVDSGGPKKRAEGLSTLNTLDPDGRALACARELKLIESADPSQPRLTALGAQICDGVKQYVNWLDHPHELARGVTPDMVRGRHILDVGCGVGCAMLTFLRYGAASVTGADLMPSFLTLCRVFAAREGLSAPRLVTATGATLPFARGVFDFVFSRLALNYMPAEDAVGEMARVATDGAWLVVTLNLLPWEWRTFLDNVRSLRARSVAYGVFKFMNGSLYHLTGRQVTLRYRGRMHAVHSPVYHTVRSVRRLLARHGFEVLGDDAARYAETPAFRARKVPIRDRTA